MEVVARDLKALGLYQARALAYDEVDILEHPRVRAERGHGGAPPRPSAARRLTFAENRPLDLRPRYILPTGWSSGVRTAGPDSGVREHVSPAQYRMLKRLLRKDRNTRRRRSKVKRLLLR